MKKYTIFAIIAASVAGIFFAPVLAWALKSNDIVSLQKGVDVQNVPNCSPTPQHPNMVLSYNGTTYSCVDNFPAQTCIPPYVLSSISNNGTQNCLQLIQPSQHCPSGSAVTLDASGNVVCAPTIAPVACPPGTPVTGANPSTSAPGSVLPPDCSPAAFPPDGGVLTSPDGVHYTCVFPSKMFPSVPIPRLGHGCTAGNIQYNLADGFNVFNSNCIRGCNDYCAAQVGFIGGMLVASNPGANVAACICRR